MRAEKEKSTSQIFKWPVIYKLTDHGRVSRLQLKIEFRDGEFFVLDDKGRQLPTEIIGYLNTKEDGKEASMVKGDNLKECSFVRVIVGTDDNKNKIPVELFEETPFFGSTFHNNNFVAIIPPPTFKKPDLLIEPKPILIFNQLEFQRLSRRIHSILRKRLHK